mmetsp:Transcript_25417/g.45955  ORF Transcript_25417/g.45955 Transcript_25417/m.45955 type:complete len:85 (+) Transcript_25417:808-1062(+)
MFHPSTKHDVARRTASAALDFNTDGRSEVRVSVNGRGSGMVKSEGMVTVGYDFFFEEEEADGKRSSRKPIDRADDDNDADATLD